MRPLAFALLLSLAIALPARAQFEVLDPSATPEGTLMDAPALHAADYAWSPLTLASFRTTGQPIGLLVVDQGTPKDLLTGKATRVRLVTLKDGMPDLGGPAFLTEGSFERLDNYDLTGDGVPEVLVRCRVGGAGTASAIPYSGKTPKTAEASATLTTTVVSLIPDAEPTVLLRYQTPVDAEETWGRLPLADGTNDLIIASFGGHAGGTTASPDAYLHFHYDSDSMPPRLARLEDLVLPPVPIDQLITTPLTVGTLPLVVTLRHFPEAKYQQQLWAQRLNPQGFFDNAPIGQGNDLLLLGPDPAVPGVQFLWHDPSTTPITTHLSSLILGADGKPATQSDVVLPFNGVLRASVAGNFIPDATNASHCRALLLETPDGSDRWLGLARFDDAGQFLSLELHHPTGIAEAKKLAAFDLNGDGTDEIVWLVAGALASYDAVTRKVSEPIELR